MRFQQAQWILKSENVDLPNKALGYLLCRQANLDKELESKLTMWLQGDFSLDAVLLNLRPLNRVTAESKRGAFFEEHDQPQDEDEPIEEDDLIEILASYQDVRNALRQTRNARGFYPPASPGAKGKKGQGKGGIGV